MFMGSNFLVAETLGISGDLPAEAVDEAATAEGEPAPAEEPAPAWFIYGVKFNSFSNYKIKCKIKFLYRWIINFLNFYYKFELFSK